MTTIHNSNQNLERSTLAHLRALIPHRPLLFSEAVRLAELQANRLLECSGVTTGPVPNKIVTDLPRVAIEYRDLPPPG